MIELRSEKEKATTGHLLEQFDSAGLGLLFMGVLVLLIALGVLVAEGFALAGPAVCFGGIGLFMSLSGFFGYVIPRRNRSRVRRRLDPITLRATHDRLRVGDSVSFELEASVQKPIEVEAVRMALMFREWVAYTEGTDTRHDEEEWVIGGEQGSIGRFETGQMLRQTLTAHIPRNAMHSFSDEHNRCTWLVKVQIAVKDMPDYVAEYPLTLIAERTVLEDTHGF